MKPCLPSSATRCEKSPARADLTMPPTAASNSLVSPLHRNTVLLGLLGGLDPRLLRQHDLDLVHGASGVADLILALGAGDLDLFALGHPLQQSDQRPHRLGNTELADEKTEQQAERDADRRNGDHHRGDAIVFLCRLFGHTANALVIRGHQLIRFSLQSCCFRPAFCNGLVQFNRSGADFESLDGFGNPERLGKILPVTLINLFDFTQYLELRGILNRLPQSFQTGLHGGGLLVDDPASRSAILGPRIHSQPVFGAIQDNDALL
jgi:hypothetical protein